jgi:hypothetical protein
MTSRSALWSTLSNRGQTQALSDWWDTLGGL